MYHLRMLKIPFLMTMIVSPPHLHVLSLPLPLLLTFPPSSGIMSTILVFSIVQSHLPDSLHLDLNLKNHLIALLSAICQAPISHSNSNKLNQFSTQLHMANPFPNPISSTQRKLQIGINKNYKLPIPLLLPRLLQHFPLLWLLRQLFLLHRPHMYQLLLPRSRPPLHPLL
jgi:hypothetical protein